MKTKIRLNLLTRLGGIVLLIEVVVIALVALMGWRAGWRTLAAFKDTMQIAGILQIGIGFMGVKGNWEGTRSFEYQYSLSATEKSSWERTQQTLVDFAQSYAFMLIMLAAGGISLLIGWLV